MKELLIFILIFVIGISILVLNVTTSKVYGWDKHGYATYVNEKYGFSVDYPDSWKIVVGKGTKDATADAYEKYNTQIFRAVSPAFTAISTKDSSLNLRGVPCIVVSEYVNDDPSFLMEVSKSGLINFTQDNLDTSKSSSTGTIVVNSFKNVNPALKGDYYGRIYKSYTLGKQYTEINKMILISIVFDSSVYDESFARDIIATVKDFSEKNIISFVLSGSVGEVGSSSVSFAMPYGTDVTSLVPAIVISNGAMISPLSGVAKNFISPVIYTVTAADKTTKSYTVTVIVAKNSAKEITEFSFDDIGARGKIDEERKTIEVIVSENTDLEKLVATFRATGNIVEIDKTAQESGKTVNNFSKPLIYRVIAEDGTYQEYEVTVTIDENMIGAH